MLGSIHPLGERSRTNRWWLTVLAHVLGATASAAGLGALLGLVGHTVGVEDVDGSTLAVLVAAAAAAALVAELHLAGARTPTVRRQVNEDWMRRYRGWVYGVGFGFQLGLGVVTVVSTPAVYLGFFLAFLSGSVWLGAAAGAAFGLGRSLVLLTAAGVREPGQLHGLHRRMERWRRPSRDILVAAEGAVALAAVLALR